VRGQTFDGSLAHGSSIGQESAEVWTAQTDSQTGQPKSDRPGPQSVATHRPDSGHGYL